MNIKSALAIFQKTVIKAQGLGGSAESKAMVDRWIPTGSLSLDAGLGGGVRVGVITMFFGEKSGGKTTSTARVAGNSQRLCRNCFREASRDLWEIYTGFPVGKTTGGELFVGEHGECDATRIEAHEICTMLGMELVATTHGQIFYAHPEDEKKNARLVQKPGGVEAVEPSEADRAAMGEEARWGARGYCSCHSEGIYMPESEPKKQAGEGQGDYNKRLARWKLDLRLNSYDEFVVAWIDVEGAYSKTWFAKLGIDNRRVLLIRPTNAEEAIDICHALVLTNEVDLMVIDSIAQLVPQKEITASMEEWQQGLQARLINKAARKIVSALSVQANRERPMTQLWINQTREKIGVMFGSPIVKPGGKGQDFAIHAEIQFNRSKVKTVNEQYGSKDEVVTIPIEETFSFKNTKNRTAGTRSSAGEYTQSMRDNDRGPAGTIIEDEYIFKLAMHYLVVADKKKGTYTLGTHVFDSQKGLLNAIKDDPEFLAAVRATLLHHILYSQSAIGGGKVAEQAE